jgi:YegS/Rv2252/BmrU family lipid kinase
MPAKVILNPYSGRWKGGERQAEIEAALQAAGVEYDIDPTTGPGHASELARHALESGFTPILAAGGDGTVSEIINGMLTAGLDELPPFGILPVGTANDLADNLGWDKDLAAAAKHIAAGKTRRLDVCEVNGRYFVNNAGLGLEPYISTIQNKMTRLRGIIRYLAATLKGVADNPQWDMELAWEGGGYRGPVTLVSVSNGPRTGGIFYTVPHADPFDGKLSFIHGHIPGRLRLLRALPMIFKPAAGNITEHPAVHEVHSPWLTAQCTPPTPAHADGEVFAKAHTDFNFRVHSGRLSILSA